MNYAAPPTHIRANRIGEETLSRGPVSESCRPRASSPGMSRLGYAARLAALHDPAPSLNAPLFLRLSASRACLRSRARAEKPFASRSALRLRASGSGASPGEYQGKTEPEMHLWVHNGCRVKAMRVGPSKIRRLADFMHSVRRVLELYRQLPTSKVLIRAWHFRPPWKHEGSKQ
jgi:hypothetical protein